MRRLRRPSPSPSPLPSASAATPWRADSDLRRRTGHQCYHRTPAALCDFWPPAFTCGHGGSTPCAPPECVAMKGVTKTVTVMFTALVGSTQLAGRLGPDATRLTELHFAALRDSLSVHRGSEVKSIGDGIMAIFESVIDGVGCAVRMQRAAARHNRRHPERPLGMRVGLSAGEAIYMDLDWYGAPVVEASRLCNQAGPSEIIVSDVVRVLAGSGGMHRLAPLGELELKGISIPTVAW